MTEEVMCIYLRAQDGKYPSDIGRNMKAIDRVVPRASVMAFMTDPRDSSVYIMALRGAADEGQAEHITRRLADIRDKADQRPLLESWFGKASAQLFRSHHYGEAPKLGHIFT